MAVTLRLLAAVAALCLARAAARAEVVPAEAPLEASLLQPLERGEKPGGGLPLAEPSFDAGDLLNPDASGESEFDLAPYEGELLPPAPAEPRGDFAPDVSHLPDDIPPIVPEAHRGRFMERLLGGPSNGRHRVWGQPLERESWLNRPFHVGGFVGVQTLSDPISGLVHGGEGFIMGGRIGWDTGHFTGVETRLTFGGASLEDPSGYSELAAANLLYWDVAMLYYPWGDTRWRPYLRVGLGLADYDFTDGQDRRVHDTLFDFPVGVGLKYRHSPKVAFRIEFLDNISFGGALQDNDHNFSFTAGAEIHFGAIERKSYWPWNPSRGWW